MNGMLKITLRYTSRDGKEVFGHDACVSAQEIDQTETAHRDPVNAAFEAASDSLSIITKGYTK